MVFGKSRQKIEEEYFVILKDRILECICELIISNKPAWFHSVDMIKECARGFLDQFGVDQYQFSGEHPFYHQVHDEILRPLVDADLLVENQNNNFTIPPDSRIHNICRRELQGKSYIKWDDFWVDSKAIST
jgi:hypothetical protein